jgi:hypothetical protein
MSLRQGLVFDHGHDFMGVPFFSKEGIYMAFGWAINLGVRSGNATNELQVQIANSYIGK